MQPKLFPWGYWLNAFYMVEYQGGKEESSGASSAMGEADMQEVTVKQGNWCNKGRTPSRGPILHPQPKEHSNNGKITRFQCSELSIMQWRRKVKCNGLQKSRQAFQRSLTAFELRFEGV